MEGPAEILIVQNVIAKNVASCGGGIFWSVTGGSHGPVVVNNTIADNDAPSGSAIFAAGYQSQTLLANNIVSAAPGQEAIACGSDAYLNYGDPPMFGNNDVFSDTLRYGGLCSDQTGMNGNIGDAPGFASPLLDDYHPGMGSPAIDKGDNLAPGLPTVDFDGNARIVDGDANGSATVDIGAYEFAAPPVGGTVDLLAGEPGDSQSSLIWVASAVGAIAGIYLPYRYIRRASARGIPRPTGAARP